MLLWLAITFTLRLERLEWKQRVGLGLGLGGKRRCPGDLLRRHLFRIRRRGATLAEDAGAYPAAGLLLGGVVAGGGGGDGSLVAVLGLGGGCCIAGICTVFRVSYRTRRIAIEGLVRALRRARIRSGLASG